MLEGRNMINGEQKTLDFRNATGETPLLLAAAKGNLNHVLALLDERKPLVADASATDNYNRKIIPPQVINRNIVYPIVISYTVEWLKLINPLNQ